MSRLSKAWLGTIFASLLALTALLSWPGADTSSAQVPPSGNDWQKVPGAPADIDFRDIFMADYRTGIAVGGQDGRGVAYRLDWTALDAWRNSLQLTPLSFNFRAPLMAAVMVGDDVWAVGEQGLIVHEHGGTWSEVTSPVPDAQLLTLQMLGNGDEGWAGGFLPHPGVGNPTPVLLHYTGGRWQVDESIKGEGSINALHFAPGGGWAVGSAGIWHYEGGTWTKEQEPNPCPETGCFQSYSAVRAIDHDEAWIAGESSGICGICVPRPYMLHREDGTWRIVVNRTVVGDPVHPSFGIMFAGLAFTDPSPNVPMIGWAVGTVFAGTAQRAYIATHNTTQPANEWHYAASPQGINTELADVSAPDRDHAIAVGTGGAILSYGYGPQPPPTLTPTPASTSVSQATPTATPPAGSNPTQRVPDPHNPHITYFPLVGHTLGGGFRDYWLQHGGLAQFGYPLTEEFLEVSPTNGKPYVTQYFERARFEYHPENRPPHDVLLGLLGRTITTGRENEAPFKRTPAHAGPGTVYFDATGHNMPPQFSTYWQQHGGLPVYGYPISEAFTEVSPTDGKPYLVQYFERNRLEFHPELPEPYRVSLGLLGVQVLQQKGWIPTR